MERGEQLVVFRLEGQRYAVPLSMVLRVVRAVEYTELPKAPEIVLGIVNVAGELAPLVDLRRRFGLATQGLDWKDQILIAQTARRLVAIPVDSVEAVIDAPAERTVDGEGVMAGLEFIEGVVKLDDGLVLVHDMDQCLSLDEEKALAAALEEVP